MATFSGSGSWTNTDGAPVFKSSNRSLWPVYYVINNLPIEERRKHIILHALWFGCGKPDMTCFHQPIIDEFNILREEGLQWLLPSGEMTTTRVVLDLTVADSVEWPLIHNFKQFSGAYGCGFCLHDGQVVDRGPGKARVYPLLESEVRTHAQCLTFAEQAESNHIDMFGVKGLSLLYLLPQFDIVNGFNHEYMHCILLHH